MFKISSCGEGRQRKSSFAAFTDVLVCWIPERRSLFSLHTPFSPSCFQATNMTSLDAELEKDVHSLLGSWNKSVPAQHWVTGSALNTAGERNQQMASVMCGMTLSDKVSVDQHKPWMADLRTQSSIWWEAKPTADDLPPRVMPHEEETSGQAGTSTGFTSALMFTPRSRFPCMVRGTKHENSVTSSTPDFSSVTRGSRSSPKQDDLDER